MHNFINYGLLIFVSYFFWNLIECKSYRYMVYTSKDFDVKQYHTYDEIRWYLRSLSRKHANVVSLIEYNRATYENRNIVIVKISNKANTGSKIKPAIFMDAGLHAREWISVSTLLYYINMFVKNYDKDMIIQDLVDKIDWYMLPMANPDGYAFTHDYNRTWRKTRSNCKGPDDLCCGVDLNRNFDFDWNNWGNDKCYAAYAGSGPASEPETRIIKNFLKDKTRNIRGYLSLHAFGQFIFYPYGNEQNSYPRDVEKLKSTAEKAIAKIKRLRYTEFEAGTAADIIYPSSGGSDDWAKAKANVSFVYGIELPPSRSRGPTFKLPETEIEPVALEFFEGLKVIAQAIADEFYGHSRKS